MPPGCPRIRGPIASLSGNVVTWRPDVVRAILMPVGEELAGVLLNEIGVDHADAIAIQSKLDGKVTDKIRFPTHPFGRRRSRQTYSPRNVWRVLSL